MRLFAFTTLLFILLYGLLFLFDPKEGKSVLYRMATGEEQRPFPLQSVFNLEKKPPHQPSILEEEEEIYLN